MSARQRVNTERDGGLRPRGGAFHDPGASVWLGEDSYENKWSSRNRTEATESAEGSRGER